MALLLVSFCNVFPRGFGLGLVELPAGSGSAWPFLQPQAVTEDLPRCRWCDTTPLGVDWLGAAGIARSPEGYWFLPQMAAGGVSALVLLDRNTKSTTSPSWSLTHS